MKWSLIFEIARALMLARLKQTLIAATGVTFSITMFVALLGFMNGLNTLLDGLILNRTPHIRFYNEIKPNPNQPIDQSPEFQNSLNVIRSIKTFPVDYNPKYYLIGGIFSLITTYFAGYFPAKKASGVDPVEIIRGK